jgi:hypothetical protein
LRKSRATVSTVVIVSLLSRAESSSLIASALVQMREF